MTTEILAKESREVSISSLTDRVREAKNIRIPAKTLTEFSVINILGDQSNPPDFDSNFDTSLSEENQLQGKFEFVCGFKNELIDIAELTSPLNINMRNTTDGFIMSPKNSTNRASLRDIEQKKVTALCVIQEGEYLQVVGSFGSKDGGEEAKQMLDIINIILNKDGKKLTFKEELPILSSSIMKNKDKL